MKNYIPIDMTKMRENDLNLYEWTLLENIHFLSNNEIGYCLKSKAELSKYLGVSDRQIYKIIDNLENKKLLKKGVKGLIKCTQKWVNICSERGLQIMQSDTAQNAESTIKYEVGRENPTEEQVISTGKQLNIKERTCVSFYLYYESRGWKGVLDFVPLLRKWNMNEKEDTAPKAKERLWG